MSARQQEGEAGTPLAAVDEAAENLGAGPGARVARALCAGQGEMISGCVAKAVK